MKNKKILLDYIFRYKLFTIPGWPLYENPGLIKDIIGVIIDTIIIKTNPN